MATATVNGDEKLDIDNLPVDSAFKNRLKKYLQEAAFDFQAILGSGLDPYDLYDDLSPGGLTSYPYPGLAAYRQNYKRGEDIPRFLDENWLRFLRDRSRKLCAENPFCQCAIENMKNYAVGEDGMVITAVSAKKSNPAPADMLASVQTIVDLFAEHNDLPEMEADIVERCMVDGEFFVRYFPQDSGLVSLRDVFPEHVKSPPGQAYGPHYSFGIQTDPDDVQTKEGYWVVEQPIINPLPRFVPAMEMSHFKWGTPKNVKRGIPFFYSTERMLRDAVDLLRGVVVTANVRARYAVIRKFTSGIVREAAQKMLNELNLACVTDPTTGQNLNVERKPFGSVVNVGANQELEFPTNNMENNQFEIALQMVLRCVAARANMPEWMLSADSSNSNYSSTLVSEAPSTKMFGRVQKMLARRIGEYRAKEKRSLVWTQVVWAVKAGLLPPEVLRLVKIQCEPSSLVVRDQAGEAQRDAAYNEMKVKSRKTIRMEQGLDDQQEKQNIAEEDREDATRALQLRATEINAQATMPNDLESDGDRVAPEGRNGRPPAGRAPLVEAVHDPMSRSKRRSVKMDVPNYTGDVVIPTTVHTNLPIDDLYKSLSDDPKKINKGILDIRNGDLHTFTTGNDGPRMSGKKEVHHEHVSQALGIPTTHALHLNFTKGDNGDVGAGTGFPPEDYLHPRLHEQAAYMLDKLPFEVGNTEGLRGDNNIQEGDNLQEARAYQGDEDFGDEGEEDGIHPNLRSDEVGLGEIAGHEVKKGQKLKETEKSMRVTVPISRIDLWKSRLDTSSWDNDSQKALAHYRKQHAQGKDFTNFRSKVPVGPPDADAHLDDRGKVLSDTLLLGDGSHRFAAQGQNGAKEVEVRVPIYKLRKSGKKKKK